MKRYSSYKDSGVEWIGEIPSHWETIKLKYQGEVIIGLSYKPENQVDEENGVLVLRSSNVQEGKLSFEDNVFVDCEIPNKLRTCENDILICSRNGSRRLIGKNSLIPKDYEGITWGVFMTVYRSKSPKFFYWLLNSPVFESQSGLFLTSTINQLTVSTLENMVVPFVGNEDEQKQIVEYLDGKTSSIDTLIQSKEKKIYLLKEKRTSLINQVVTKGLNPNVEMKDSGVEWIGEIPREWSVSRFRHYVKLRHGYQFRDYDFTDSGIKIVKITQLHRDGYLDLTNCSTIDPSRVDDFSDICIYEKDILMCLTGGTIGKIIRVGKVNEPLLQNYRVGHFSTKRDESLTNDFLFYLMSSNVIIGQIFYEVRETGQPNIGLEDMNGMMINLPPLNEQKQIVEYLDRETELIDKTVSIEQRKIEVLKEFKQSLISEVITGKRKVVSDE